MSRSEIPTRGPAHSGPYVVSGILLAVGIVMPLIVPLYAREDPRLFGIPFFYWYQMLWVFIDAFLLWIVYLVMTREDRRRRAAVQGPGAGGRASTDAPADDAGGRK